MKEKIIVAVAITACVLLTGLSLRTFHDDEWAARVKAQQTAASQQKVADVEKKHQAQIKAALQQYEAQCQTQLKAYNLLPLSQQARQPKPQCNLQPVQ